MFNEFKKFILRGNVVDLAVGIAIGAAFTSFVNALVKDFVTPLVNIFYKGDSFANAHVTIRGSEILYGDLINAFITFLVVAIVIFFFVVKPINKLQEFSFGPQGVNTRKCPYCMSKVPKAATKCMYCTSNLPKKD